MKRLMLTLLIGSLMSPKTSWAETCTAPQATNLVELELHALYPNPKTGEKEWIEIANPTQNTADLSHYTLEDATHHPMTLSGTLEGHEIIRIENLSFQLNNGAETVQLKTESGTILDEWAYDSTQTGEILTRTSSSSSTETTTVTTQSQTEASNNSPSITPAEKPELSEIMANPEGSDGEAEWIELFNPHAKTITLNGLQLDDEEGGSKPFALSGTIEPESYRLFYSEETHITLNNTVDHIRLLDAQSEIIWDYSYDSVHEGQSHILVDGKLEETKRPTPNGENEISVPSETTNENDESETNPDLNPNQNGDLSEDIELSELLPNPEGSDTEGEWIELTNGSDQEVNLGNWIIDDGAGGSKPFVIPAGTIIKPGETLVFPRSVSKISLGNTEETLNLIDWNGETQDEVSYKNAKEGQAYAKIKVEEMEGLQASTSGLGPKATTTWQWISPSPGVMNPEAWLIQGTVKSFENNSLVLAQGAHEWAIQMNPSPEDVLLYQLGNELKIEAMEADGMLIGMSTELLKTAPQSEQKNSSFEIPWLGLIFAGAGGAYLWNEWRKNKVKTELSPVLKFN